MAYYKADSSEATKKLCEILGIDYKKVGDISIFMSPGEPVTINIDIEPSHKDLVDFGVQEGWREVTENIKSDPA